MKSSSPLFNSFYLIIVFFFLSFYAAAQENKLAREDMEYIELSMGKIYLSGTSKLTEGISHIVYDEKYTRIIPENDTQVILTPVNTWSGLYVTEATTKGFTVKSESGDKNADFNWVLICVKKPEEKNIQGKP